MPLPATTGREKEGSDGAEQLDTPALTVGARLDLLLQPLDGEDKEPPLDSVRNHRRISAPIPKVFPLTYRCYRHPSNGAVAQTL